MVMMRRKYSKWTIITLSAGLFLASCDQFGNSGKDLKLLTSNPWKYEQAGFLTDGQEEEGSFDALDPRIAGSEKDDRIVFRTDGTGSFEECKVKCKTSGPKSLPFIWSFQNNDSTIYFQDRYYKVKTLTNNRLVLYADQELGATHTRYTIVMKH